MSFPFGEMLSHHEESCGCSSFFQLFCFDSIWKTQKVSLLKSRTTANKTLLSGKEEKQHECTWTSPPDDIMELIMKRLCLKDCLGLSEICTPWRDIVANAIANKHFHRFPELPLLVLFTPLTVLRLLTHCQPSPVFSLRTKRLFYPKRPLFEKRQTVRGSVEGWMIVSEYSNGFSLSLSVTIFFFNPVTNAKVFVPSVLKFPSNSPLLADKLSDKSWTTIEVDKDTGVHFLDVEIIDTKLGKVFASLAKDDALGDLFLIHMFINVAYETRHVGYLNKVTEFVAPPELTRVEVFKLNTSNETNQWIKVDNLGDRVLFRDVFKGMVV
ncbi:uncharacterized protein LOC133317299 [Gastrolobium bilobum]|uniref:uncharacterized protein LOC133317299 n=1 Tax=Gastrolobium bilobum TaxID=150636 RepID=UPI002AB19B22|nr:uncharacterized protein LOC133317299 [Gastrolobium bilobum]